MNYELAKKLKEAGFPQGSWGEYYSGGRLYSGLVPKSDVDDDVFYVPVLEELIDACGKKFSGLICVHSREKKTFKAIENIWLQRLEPSNSFRDFIKGKVVSGDTPEDAVANLWLALNKTNE